jgi:hypothetical protein
MKKNSRLLIRELEVCELERVFGGKDPDEDRVCTTGTNSASDEFECGNPPPQPPPGG